MNKPSTSPREDLRREGYSKEEEYFYRINRELIRKRRQELDQKRLEQRERGLKSIHWMKCPKCGGEMKETDLSGICADQCTNCSGIYFDYDEFRTLLEAQIPRNFLKTLMNRIWSKLSQSNMTWKP